MDLLREVSVKSVFIFYSFFLGAVMFPVAVPAQNVEFSLEGAEVVPGEEFTLLLRANIDQSIRGFQLGFEFPQSILGFLGASLSGTDLQGMETEALEVDSGPGYGTFKVLLPGRPGLENPIPAGQAVRLVALKFRISQWLAPGSLYQIQMMSDLGIPPVPALVYAGTGTLAPGALGVSQVKISDQNVLRIRDLHGIRLNEVKSLEFSVFNILPLQGFSIGVKFDPTIFRFLQADIGGTITESVGAEYVAPVIDNTNGYFILGVLLDALPPFDHQLIPATGLDLTIAKAQIQLIRAPAEARSVEMELVDGLGSPPIRNVVVIDNFSYAPLRRNGQVDLLIEGSFIRGDANSDGKLNIADPVWILNDLFMGGPPPSCKTTEDADDDGKVNIFDPIRIMGYYFLSQFPITNPFPACGADPTPGPMTCESYPPCGF